MASTIVLNGVRHEISMLGDEDISAGTMVKDRYGRNVYRILCVDHGDVVVRNVRRPDLLRAFPANTFPAEFVRVLE